jgi:hypothetical protein
MNYYIRRIIKRRLNIVRLPNRGPESYYPHYWLIGDAIGQWEAAIGQWGGPIGQSGVLVNGRIRCAVTV